jgi:hypothetical protein
MRYRFAICLCFLVSTACASIVADDEVKGLQAASSVFSDALRTVDSEAVAARDAQIFEEQRAAVSAGMRVRFSEECRENAEAANLEFSRVVQIKPYNSNAVDKAFGAFASLTPCGFDDRQRTAAKSPEGPPLTFSGVVAGSGSDTLSGTSRQLDAYVVALADVATGDTADKTDAARSQLIAAGKGLLAATKISGLDDKVIDLAATGISSIIAAKRNAVTQKFLNEMDPAMPTLMERIALAARYQHAAVALNRSKAAQAIAHTANRTLSGPQLVPRRAGQGLLATTERMALFDEAAERLAVQNTAFVEVTAGDPAIAARAFADAHHELTAVYNNPRSNRLALAKGLGEFTEAAVALNAALNQSKE